MADIANISNSSSEEEEEEIDEVKNEADNIIKFDFKGAFLYIYNSFKDFIKSSLFSIGLAIFVPICTKIYHITTFLCFDIAFYLLLPFYLENEEKKPIREYIKTYFENVHLRIPFCLLIFTAVYYVHHLLIK